MGEIQFGDYVEVLSGFFEGCKGIVINKIWGSDYEIEALVLDAWGGYRIIQITGEEGNLKLLRKREE